MFLEKLFNLNKQSSFLDTKLFSGKTLNALISKIPPTELKTRNYLCLPTPKNIKFDKVKYENLYETWEYEEDSSVKSEKTLDTDLLQTNWLLLNRYGALILCSEELLAIDIDDKDALDISQQYLVNLIRETLDPFYTVIYRTAEGFRVLSTFPTAYNVPSEMAKIKELLLYLGCDKKYVECLNEQKYARIRLTPKPWRFTIGEDVRVAQIISIFGTYKKISPTQKEAFRVHDALAKVFNVQKKLA